ncbi:MAG TPA: hypothetical protein GX724_02295, partial [Fibrobacter sp.]|nr:hypothetical protein [Fibrobacter sp.]
TETALNALNAVIGVDTGEMSAAKTIASTIMAYERFAVEAEDKPS